jgi:undecaprenyl-diphosphatase
MGLLQAVVLAVVQGITEFLPVSSKTHMAIAGNLLGVDQLPVDFVVAVHLGTLIAVIVFYRRDLLAMVLGLVGRGNTEAEETPDQFRRLFGLLILATVPAAIAGALLESRLEALLNNMLFDGIGWLAIGTLLVLANRLQGSKTLQATGPRDALLIGVAQACALLPGISRSGSTIIAGLACGLRRDWAPRFAFLMSVPIILGGALMEARHMLNGNLSVMFDPVLYAVAAAVAGLFGYLAIILVTDSVRRGNLLYYGVYCLVAGVLAISASAIAGP